MADSIVGSLVYDIKANSLPLDAGLAESSAKVKGWGAANGETIAKVGAGIVAAGLAVAGVAVDMAAKFQTSTTQLAVNAGISTAAANAIGDAFLGTALKSEFSAEKLMTAFAPVAGQLESTKGSALTTAESLQFMTAASDLASASGQDLNATTQDLAKVMQTFALPVSQAASVTDTLLNSSNAAGVSLDAWTAAVARAGAMAGAAKPSVQDLSTFLLDLQNHGETGRAAMGLLGSTLNGLMTPTQAVIDEQKKLGVAFIDAKGQLDPLNQIIAQVAPKIQGMGNAQATATLKSLGFGAASDKLVQTIQGGSADWDKYAAEVNKTGTAADGAAEKQKTFAGQLEILKSFIEDTAIKLGQLLAPALAVVTEWLTDHLQAAVNTVTHFWNDHQQAIFGVISAIYQFVSGVAQQLIHVLSDIVTWVGQNRQWIGLLADILRTTLLFAIQAVVNVLGFFTDHLAVFGPLFVMVIGGLLAFKAAMLIQDVIQGASIALFMFQAGLEGVSVAEVGASTTSYALGAAIDTMLGPVGIAVVAVTAIVGALVGMAVQSQQAKDAVDKWNAETAKWQSDQVNALQTVNQGWQNLQGQVVKASDVIKTFQDNINREIQLPGVPGEPLVPNEQQMGQLSDWIKGLDQANLKIVSLMTTLPHGSALISQFHDQLALTGGDGTKAIDNMSDSSANFAALLQANQGDMTGAWQNVAGAAYNTAKETRYVKLAMDELKNDTDIGNALNEYNILLNQQGATADSAMQKLRGLSPAYADLVQDNNTLADAMQLPRDQFSTMQSVTFGGVTDSASHLITKVQEMAAATGLSYDQVVNLAQDGGGQMITLADGAVVHLTGNMSQWQAEIDAANAKVLGLDASVSGIPDKTITFTFNSNIKEVMDGVNTFLQEATASGGYVRRSAAGGKFSTPQLRSIAEEGPEWVINEKQAGEFAPLLDKLVGAGAALSSPLGTISPPATVQPMAPTTNIIMAPEKSEASPVTVQLNMSGVMTRSRAELRGVAMDMLDAVNEGLKSKGMAPLPIRQVPL